MAQSVADVMKMKSQVKMVDLRFVDMPGTWQHLSLPVRELTEELFEEGHGFDGSSIRGFKLIHESDMLLMPDAATAFIDPVLEVPTLVHHLRCVRSDDPPALQPRSAPRGAEGRSLPQADRHRHHQLLGPGSRILHVQRCALRRRHQQLLLLHRQRRRLVEQRRRSPSPTSAVRLPPSAATSPCPPPTRSRTCARSIVLALEAAGVPIEVHHHEVATAGQAEIDMRFDTMLKMADNVMVYKYLVKNVARQNGLTATFMPKPLFGDNGSGMHVHQSLWEGRHQCVLRCLWLRRAFRHSQVLHRRSAQALFGPAGHCSPHHQLVPPPGARFRGTRQIWPTRSATARPSAASRCIRRAPRPSASSSARPIRPATRTCASPPC